MHCARCVEGDSIGANPGCARDRLRCRGPTVDAHATGPVTARQARSIRLEEARMSIANSLPTGVCKQLSRAGGKRRRALPDHDLNARGARASKRARRLALLQAQPNRGPMRYRTRAVAAYLDVGGETRAAANEVN